MRTLRSLTVLSLLLALPATIALAQDVEADEKAIKATVDQWVAGWDGGDIAAVAALYAEAADYVDLYGQRHEGRAAIQKAFTDVNAGPYKGTKLKLTTISVRFVTPTLAVSDSKWEMTEMPETEGEAAPAKGLSTAVMVKQGEQWLITAHRSRVPFTPPAPPE